MTTYETCKHCGRPIVLIEGLRGYTHAQEGIGWFCPAVKEGEHIVQARFAEPLREPARLAGAQD